jgi:hypothetical protein
VPQPNVQQLAGLDLFPDPFPKSVYLETPGEPVNNRPASVIIHPQSYFDLNVDDQRFGSIIPPLDPSYRGIMLPSYIALLEGLVHCFVHPPGLFLASTIAYLLDDVLEERKGKEKEVLKIVTTDAAKWYMGIVYNKGRTPWPHELLAYRDRLWWASDYYSDIG